MRIITFFIISILFFFLNASCQKEKSDFTFDYQPYYPFVKENAIWKVRIATQRIPYYIEYYTIHNDTIIDAVKYKKIYNSKDSITLFNFNDSSCWGAVREKNKKVYYYEFKYSKEILLYDFSLNMGEQYVDKTGRTWEVIRIDSIFIENKYRKQWKLCNSINCAYGDKNEDIWIEGIGSTFGIFPSVISSYEMLSRLVCYQEKDFVQCNFILR